MGTPLTKTQGKESEKNIRVIREKMSNKRKVKVKLKSRWKRERKQRKEKGKLSLQHQVRR